MYKGAPLAMRRHFNSLELPDVAASSGPPVHYGTDDLPVEQDSFPYAEDTTPVQERTKHSQSLSGFLPNMIDVRRPG